MAGLLSGLAAGLNFYANELASNRKEDREIEVMRQKMLMANQLEMDLLKQKQAFAQQFPQYEHFEKMPNGVIVGIDRMGNGKDVYTPSDENQELARKAYDINQMFKTNQAAVTGERAKALGLLTPVQADKAAADAVRARAAAAADAAKAGVIGKPKPIDEVTRASNLEKLINARIAQDPSAQLPIDFLTKKPYISAEAAAQDDLVAGQAWQAAAARRAAIRNEVMRLQGQGEGLVAPTAQQTQSNPSSEFDSFIPADYDPASGQE